ncbi:hypothetical protein DSCO28_24880 [Desulfosarcina ovata subsp. sediminis]|uniref:Uncharacterized protein n=1 Tax=Desulfosarcina ovata subsp. sediminis TaxID=885957 RepID=A0A5K7ZIH0_9BACT|nr:hypothetical protein DSCO28_24880 [Desulfosarcina ovata subsp. sediminis]
MSLCVLRAVPAAVDTDELEVRTVAWEFLFKGGIRENGNPKNKIVDRDIDRSMHGFSIIGKRGTRPARHH